MSFCVYGSDIAICGNEHVVIYNVDNDTEEIINLSPSTTAGRLGGSNNLDIRSFHTLTSIAFSMDGQYFFICTNRKQLYLYERKNRKLLSCRTLFRAASRVRFSSKNDIVVADKAGDVYIYSTNDPLSRGTYVMGHLSMLLDVLITEDGNYILTTDRDEKIRVSLFPNSYNILAYCLGHTKFVTNISELPHDANVLVSTGGDGIVLLWDYKNGKQLGSINISQNISDHDIDVFKKTLKAHHFDESADTLPVRHLVLSAIDCTMSLMVLTFWCNSNILIYTISGKKEGCPYGTYVQTVSLGSEPLECRMVNTDTWILTESGIKVYEFDGGILKDHGQLNQKLMKINNSWSILRKSISKHDLFPVLYKRKYDNVQQYLERKRSRFASKTE